MSGLVRSDDALASYAKSAETLDWIRGGMLPEHASGFMGRRDVQSMLTSLIEALEAGGRGDDAEPLKEWVGASAPNTTTGS